MKYLLFAFVILLCACAKQNPGNYTPPPPSPPEMPYGVHITVDSMADTITTANTAAYIQDWGCPYCFNDDAEINEYVIQLYAEDSTDPLNSKNFSFFFDITGLAGGVYLFDNISHWYPYNYRGRGFILPYVGVAEYADSSGTYLLKDASIYFSRMSKSSIKGSFNECVMVDTTTQKTKKIAGDFFVNYQQ